MTANRIYLSTKPGIYKIIFLFISLLCLYNFSFAKTSSDTIKINGTVKDENGKAIEHAAIIFDSTQMTTTGTDGKFSFELSDISRASHNIYFTADGYITVIRSYNPVMGSSNYDLVLRKLLGISTQTNIKVVHVIKNDTAIAAIKDTPAAIQKDTVAIKAQTNEPVAELDFPSILFRPNTTALTGQDKAFLDIITARLKENPTIKVDIKAYTHQPDYTPSLSQIRLANLINYLKKAGIADSRINKKVVPKGGDENTIDVIQSKE